MAHDPLAVLVHQATPPSKTVIAVLHGHGDDPQELLDRFARLVPADTTVVAPIGPVRTADGAPAWFVSAPGDAPERTADEGSLAEAVHRLAATLLGDAGPAGADEARTPDVLFGYSQGAAAALALAFGAAPARQPRPQTVVTVAAWLPSDPEVVWDFTGAAPYTRAVLLHGEDDEVVDPQMGRSAARVLARSGVEAELVEVPGGHALVDDGIVRLLAQLGPNSAP